MPEEPRVRFRDNRPTILRLLKQGAAEGLEDVGDKIVMRAIRRAPKGKGDLRRAIRRSGPAKIGSDSVHVQVGVYSDKAMFPEFGTASMGEPVGSTYHSPVGKVVKWPSTPPGKKTYQPYPIKPKNKQALRWKSGKNFKFAKKVMHPGIKATPYFRPSVDETVKEAPGIISSRIKKRLRESAAFQPEES